MNNVKIHTDISVQDKYNAKTVYAPDPQIRENYEAFVQYVRELELRMRGYSKQENVIDGLIASYECYDYTNESDGREILTDLTGNGHDIQLYNFAFAENSGFGLYGTNFNKWSSSSSVNVVDRNYKQVVFSANTKGASVYLSNFGFSKIKIRVLGLDSDCNLNVQVYNGSESSIIMTISENGIHEVTNIPEDAKTFYFALSKVDNVVTIEQIPDYKGALVSDGIDDYGLCDNFPILTKEKGYTVFMIRKILSDKGYYIFTNSSSPKGLDGFCQMERVPNSNTISYGSYTSVVFPDLLTYQTSLSYNNKTINRGNCNPTNKIGIFTYDTSGQYNTSVALYALEIYDRDLTDEEIAKVKERMIKRYEEKTGETYVEEVTA